MLPHIPWAVYQGTNQSLVLGVAGPLPQSQHRNRQTATCWGTQTPLPWSDFECRVGSLGSLKATEEKGCCWSGMCWGLNSYHGINLGWWQRENFALSYLAKPTLRFYLGVWQACWVNCCTSQWLITKQQLASEGLTLNHVAFSLALSFFCSSSSAWVCTP